MNVNQCIAKNSHYVQIPEMHFHSLHLFHVHGSPFHVQIPEMVMMTMPMMRMRMKRMTPTMMRMKNPDDIVAMLDFMR